MYMSIKLENCNLLRLAVSIIDINLHYKLSVSDVDGDVVRCRWAESSDSECSGVCQTFPATLDEVSCWLLCIATLL